MSVERKLNNISCKEYCTIHNLKYSVLKEENSQKNFIPDYRDNPIADNYINVKCPEIYIAELDNMFLVGGCSITFDENNHCIYSFNFKF